MNDVLRIARLKIALQRAFLGRAILIFTSETFPSVKFIFCTIFWHLKCSLLDILTYVSTWRSRIPTKSSIGDSLLDERCPKKG